MNYETVTLKGNVLSAEWIKDHIELVVWNAGHVQIEWAFTMNYAVHRFEWLMAHA